MSEVTLDEVANLIRQEARGKLPPEGLSEGTRLDDLALSSLQVAEIVFSLEEEHEVEFDESRAADVKTLGDVIALANDAIRAAGDLAEREAA